MASVSPSQTLELSSELDRLPIRFGGSPPPSSVRLVSSARLGMLLFIASETMLFAGLLAVYVAFRFGSITWPSAHLFLPVGVTWVNTFVLLLSCVTMRRALAAGRTSQQQLLVRYLALTALLGVFFLSVQGYEWSQLVRDGLTITTGIYGATFYVLIGCHAFHVLCAVIWLLVVVWNAKQRYYSVARLSGVENCGLYWYFVGGLWVVLFGLVYLS